MFGLGTIVNTIAVVAGGIIGLLFKNGLKNRYQETIMQGIGLAVLFVGISGAMTGMLKISKEGLESTGSLILVLSLCFGALLGEFINIEKRIEQFGIYLKNKVKSNDSKFIDGFVSTSLVICVWGMAIVGSVLIFAVGTNLCFHTKIKVGNLLPAVFMPLLLALFI